MPHLMSYKDRYRLATMRTHTDFIRLPNRESDRRHQTRKRQVIINNWVRSKTCSPIREGRALPIRYIPVKCKCTISAMRFSRVQDDIIYPLSAQPSALTPHIILRLIAPNSSKSNPLQKYLLQTK